MSPADADETLLAELELTRGLTIQMTAITTLGMVVAVSALIALYRSVTGAPPTFGFGPGVGWWTSALDVLAIVFLATVFVVPHELLHGLAIRYYGGEARYGVGVAHFILPYAYATTDHELSRNQFLVVLLTPLVAITAVGVPVMLAFEWGWLIVPLAANAAGAVADVWMVLTLVGYPAHVRIADHAGGVRIWGRATDRPRRLSVTAVVWDALAGGAVATFAVLLALAVAGPFALSALGVESVTVGTPGTVTYLFSFVSTPTEISFGVGPAVFAVGAAVGLAYALVRSYLRARKPLDDVSDAAPAGRR